MIGDTLQCTNDATWNVFGKNFAARTMKLIAADPRPAFHSIIGHYDEVTYQFEYDYHTHDLKLLDNGMNQVVLGKKVEIRTDSGLPVTQPVALDGSGVKLSSTSASPVYLTFKILREKDFASVFGFPTSAHRPV